MNIGDLGRLNHLKESLQNGKQLYNSDLNYLDSLVSKYLDNKEISQDPPTKSSQTTTEYDNSNLNTNKSNSETLPLLAMINSKISVGEIKDYVIESAQKNSKGGFLGKGKIPEKPYGIEKMYYPYYEYSLESLVTEIEKRGWFKKEKITKKIETKISVDGRTGAIVKTTSSGLSYDYAFLQDLSMDEVNMLYYISRYGEFQIRDLDGLGHGDAKKRRLASGLHDKGVLRQTKVRPISYKTRYPYPYDPISFESISEKHSITFCKPEGKLVETNFDAITMNSQLDRYWINCKILSSELIYYPYYVVSYQRENNTKRLEVIDAVTGIKQPKIEQRISINPSNNFSSL